MSETIERKLVPSLREGVDIVRMIFFKKMKEHLTEKYPNEDTRYPGMLAGAILNELFNTRNPDESYAAFATANKEVIDREITCAAQQFPDLCIPLTDALRIHFLCNHQEGIIENNEEILSKARDYGILIEERDVPLPKGFMELVHRIGVAYGILNPSN
jgi:hypothetical protein